MAVEKKRRPASPHVHPEERPKVAALNQMAARFVEPPPKKVELSYYSPILIQCTLPHSDPGTHVWIKTSGSRSLILASGIDETGEFIGLPYGSFPRMVLAYIITSVTRTRGREVTLASHFSTFLKSIGYTSNHKGRGVKGSRLREQLIRLLRTSITFQDRGAGHYAVEDVKIAPKFDLWFDAKNPDAHSVLGSRITVSEEFRDAILRAPVPLRTDILAALKKSPLALDVYMWASYRLFQMQARQQEEITLSHSQLQTQFGTGIAPEHYRQFRAELKLAFAKVAGHWIAPDGSRRLLHYDFKGSHLTLYRSPLLVPKQGKVKLHDERVAILEQRRFDIDTYRQARQLAGSWSVEYLAEQYFNWIEAENIEPRNPVAHFLDFVKIHCERNGFS